MKLTSRWLITCSIVFLKLSVGHSQVFDAKQQLPTDKFFKQITGTWKLANRQVIEQWTRSTSGGFQARVLDLSKGDSTLTEMIKVIKDKGQVYFEAKVLDQNEGKPIRFKLEKNRKKRVRFANSTHNFPQVIEYRLTNPNTLQVQISGMVRKKMRKINFEYQRVN